MLEVPIRADMIERAERRAREMGILNKSFMKGRGNVVGFLGEEIVLAALPGSRLADDYNYDIEWEGARFEVKTKRTTASPLPYYMCSVSDHNTLQDTNNYIFCRVLSQNGMFTKGWVLGYIAKGDFFRRARFMRKGEKEGDNGYIVKNDCWSVRIDELCPLSPCLSD